MYKKNKTNTCLGGLGRYWLVGLLSLPASGFAATDLGPATVRPPINLRSLASHTSRIIVHYRALPAAAAKSTLQLQSISRTALLPLSYHHTMASGSHVLSLPGKMTVMDARQVAQRVARDPNVLYAEPDYPIYKNALPAGFPNDPLFADQWNLGTGPGAINVKAAWAITLGKPGIVMAVLDSGILPTHPEFQGRLLPGFNFISDPTEAGNSAGRNSDPTDLGDWCTDPQTAEPSDWHGSHVAGIMGARINNGFGIAGVAPEAMILPVRVIGRCGGTESDTLDAMRWAVGMSVTGAPVNPHPARVINMSLGVDDGSACPTEFQAAINDVRAHHASVVVSAGNDGVNMANQWPANCKGVISVAAVDQKGNVQNGVWATNFGTGVTIAAPGTMIASTVNAGTTIATTNRFGYLDGTSQASPQVAGVIALMLSVNPNLSPDQVTQLLIQSRRPFASTASCSGICQAGMLDAGRAVKLAAQSVSGNAIPATTNSSVPMTVSSSTSQSVRPGTQVVLQGHVQAPVTDGIVSWGWQQISGTRVTLAGANTPRASFIAPQSAGALVFRWTVKDKRQQQGSSTSQVNVVLSKASVPGQPQGTSTSNVVVISRMVTTVGVQSARRSRRHLAPFGAR